MEIAKIQVTGTKARTVSRRPIPAGLIGGYITVEYTDAMWSGLTKTVVFQGAVTKDVITGESIVKIPPETVAAAGCRLMVGFYGTDTEGNVAIPTFWAEIGPVIDAADPSGDETTDGSLPVYTQLAERIAVLEENGTGGTGAVGPQGPAGPQGEAGEPGGYYTPAVTQPDAETVEFSFTASKEDMPEVKPVQVTLPGAQGVYELIETVTLEEASTLALSQEPDGTPYAFKGVYIKIKAPTNPTGSGTVWFYSDTTQVGRSWTSSKTADGVYYCVIDVRVDHGYWASRWSDWLTNSSGVALTYGDMYGRGVAYAEAEYPTITKFSHPILPAGTIIEIWGVRA